MAAERRYDPERRRRIIEACVEVIAENGVDGTSHRKVAQRAGVPLGSTTYHFTGRDELLREALMLFADSVADRFEARLAALPVGGDEDRVVDELVALILEDVFPTPRDLVLTHELYTLAARSPAFRELTMAWMARSRAALERHVDPLTARLLDALIEGLTIHHALGPGMLDAADIAEAVRRIVSRER
ncbi:TetR/AcrR family transcriptional regulator [Brachybacterium sp. J153]|uniref:TetR/AcrR family transcriptional regulator n=1 Tax=Brachybacterium sp. J153 TaxID=3116488 RepID=UPI002E78E8AF|nr:TetR family transcriptional regulator [Brachybacterium sp. J153]MEE1617024.1 TetR family transcriptional regulator [Brachybacterium sp. J153]